MRSTMALVLVVLLGGIAFAEIPQVISYQGKVTDASGNPVADGPYTMQFRIYDAATGGTLLWNSNNQTVSVSGGVFSVLLGESPQPGLGLDFSQDYWLLMIFNGVNQTPRQRLASVGYAYMASGLVAGTEVSGSVTSGTSAAITGTNTATEGNVYGIYGQSASTLGRGVLGWATATSGETCGVRGLSVSTNGCGVHGGALATSGTTIGGNFLSLSTGGYGVYGVATATVGSTYGGYFLSSSIGGCGAHGWALATSGETYGVYGKSFSTAGRGVYGVATATTGAAYGVFGETNSSSGHGVLGVNYATTGYTGAIQGIAMSSAGRAVSGECNGTEGIGVVGWAGATTGGTNGVFGYSSSPMGAGVVGQAAATTGGPHGVYGTSAATAGRGVTGIATATYGATYGVYGQSDSGSGYGVYGDGYSGVYGDGYYGVVGHSTTTYGYGVYYSGGLAGTGSKSCVVKTSKGPTLLYCQESPENWFEDFGEGQLVNGRCHIELDPVFLETVTIDAANPMKVFVQPQDLGCKGLAAIPGTTGFDVGELLGGTSKSAFAYRVVAKRKGFEAKRLDVCEAARTDSYLYPELREKQSREHQAERVRMEEDHARREQERARMAGWIGAAESSASSLGR